MKKLSILPLVLLVPTTAAAEVVPLAPLEDRAVRRSPAMRATREAIRRAHAEGDEAAAARIPTLGLRANAALAPGGELIDVEEVGGGTRQVFASPSWGESDALDPVPRFGVTASARWRVLDFGRSGAAEGAAELAATAGELGVEAVEQEIRLAVRRAYLRWAAARELHSIALEGSNAAQERAARVQRLIDSGQRPEADGAAAAVDQTTARLALARSGARLATARWTLEAAAGEPLPDDAEPDTRLIDEGPAPLEGDPTDRSLQASRAAANALADGESYRYRPLLDLEADIGLRGQSNSQFPVYRGGIVLSWPLYDGGAGSAREHAARADARRLDAELEAHRRRHAAYERLAETAAEQAEATRAAARALVQAAETRLDAAEAAYDRGVGSTEVIAAARETLRHARAEEVMARVDLAEAQLR